MARINPRPDIIYVKDLTDQDKDNFEKIQKKFRTTNNGEAIKKALTEYLKNEDLIVEKSKEILKLQADLQNAEKEKKKFLSDTDKLIKSISTVEDSLKSAKNELIKLK